MTSTAVSSKGCTTTPAARTADSSRSSSSRRTSYSLRAMAAGSSFNAHSRPSASTKRTRWRLGPTGTSWMATLVASHSPSGSSHGRLSSSAEATLRRRSSRGAKAIQCMATTAERPGGCPGPRDLRHYR